MLGEGREEMGISLIGNSSGGWGGGRRGGGERGLGLVSLLTQAEGGETVMMSHARVNYTVVIFFPVSPLCSIGNSNG